MFYRVNPNNGGYAICCGLEQLIDYIKELHFSYEDIEYLRELNVFDEDFLNYLAGFHFSGDIYAIPEGSIVFPMEPLVKVIAPIMEAQLVETAILCIMNHQSLIATKAARVCYAAQGDGVMEFGLRRAQGPDAATLGQSCCYSRLRRHKQCSVRQEVWTSRTRNTCTQLDNEFFGRAHRFPQICRALS